MHTATPLLKTSAYIRLQQTLIARIRSGQWIPGDQLPTERQMAEEFQVSIGTVRKAMDTLTESGYCHRIQGKGTFVTEYPADRTIFYKMRKTMDSPDVRILPRSILRQECPLPEEAAHALRRITGSPGLSIARILYASENNDLVPLGYTCSWFPLEQGQALLTTPVEDLHIHSLYHLAERDCGLPCVFCDELTHICTDPPIFVRNALGTSCVPCFEMRMVSHTYSKIPFEFRLSYLVGGSRGIIRRHDLRF